MRALASRFLLSPVLLARRQVLLRVGLQTAELRAVGSASCFALYSRCVCRFETIRRHARDVARGASVWHICPRVEPHGHCARRTAHDRPVAMPNPPSTPLAPNWFGYRTFDLRVRRLHEAFLGAGALTPSSRVGAFGFFVARLDSRKF